MNGNQQKKNKVATDIIGTVQKNLMRATSALTLAGALTMTSSAYAAVGDNETPTGFSLQAGTVAAPVLSGAGNKNMSLTQTTSRAVINWTTFNIGKDAKVDFNQTQGKNSIAVNRVTGPQNDPSQILGQLKANGRVMILDRNGVMFGAQSKVDVAGLFASTGDLADQAGFMDGADQFILHNVNAVPGAKIESKGQISIKDGGLMAFVAPYIENSGTITAKLGKVSLASSTKVTVDLTGDSLITFAASDKIQSSPVAQALIKNSGDIIAEGGVVNLSANVAKGVVDEAINMSGVIKANSFQTQNGKIILSGGGGKVKVSGKLEANRDTTSGEANSAGSIRIEGDEVEITDAALISATIAGVTTTTTTTTYIDTYTYSYTKSGVTKSAPSIQALIALYPTNTSNALTNILNGVIVADILLKSATNNYNAQLKRVVTQVPVETTTTTHADGHGDGGNVYIWGGSKVTFAGKIDVSAGATGNGGSAEISGDGALGYTGLVDASAVAGTMGTLTIDPPVITIGNSLFDPVVNAAALAETLGLSNVHIIAGDKIIVADEADLSQWSLGGFTSGDLTLDAPTLDILADLSVGNGDLDVSAADTINLGGKLQRKQPGLFGFGVTTSLLGQPDFGPGYASVVNVLGDAALINQAIDLAAGGGTVNVAWGNYNENINIYKSLTLKGDGSMPLLFGTNLFGNVILVSANNVTVDGFNIDGAHAPWYLPHLYGIYANGVSGLTVKNNSFRNFLGAGVKLDGTTGSTVDNNVFNLTATAIDIALGSGHSVSSNNISGVGTGIRLSGVSYTDVNGNTVTGALKNAIEAAGFDYSSIAGNFILGAGLNGIAVDGGTDVSIAGNAGGVIGGDTINVRNVNGLTVAGNVVGLSGDDAIELTDVSGATVKLNAAGLSTNNALELNNVSGADVFLNVFGGTTNGDGIKVNGGHDIDLSLNAVLLSGDDGIDVNGAHDVNVVANVVSGSGGNGIEVINTSDANIALNAVANSGGNGVFVDPSTGVVAFNYITGSGANGIHVLDSNGFHVLANHVEGSGANGILVQNSDGVLVSLNHVKDSGNDGIHVEDSVLNLVLANKVRNSGGDGIDVERAAGTVVSFNDVEGSEDNGIEVSESLAALVSHNDVKDSGKDGIRVSNAALTLISRNDVSESGEDGIGLYTSLGAFIKKNNVSKSGDDGIDVHHSAGTFVIDNDVEKSKDDGIDVDHSAGVLVDDNKVVRSGDNGIEVSDSAFVRISDNDVRKSGDDGIDLSGSAFARIVDNKVRDSGDDGIDVSGDGRRRHRGHGHHDGVEIVGNDVRDSDDNGIEVSDISSVLISENKVKDSGEDGINVRDVSSVDILDNEIDESGDDGIDVSGNGGWYGPVGMYFGDGDDYDDEGHGHSMDRGVRIIGNNVDESGDNGIQVTELDRVRIARNNVDDSYNNGIFVRDVDYVRIRRNEVSDSGHEGWVGDDYYGWYERVGDGIHVEGGHSVRIVNNEVDESADDGIDVSGSDYDDLALRSGFGDGYRRKFGVHIIGNDVDDSGDNGIEVTSLGNARIAHNDVHDSGSNGIFVGGLDYVKIRKNHVHGGNNAGIYVVETMFSDIVRNDVSDFYNGIVVHYALGSRIHRNDVSHVWNDGIQASNVGGFGPALSIMMEGDEQEGGEEEISYDLEITNNTVSHYFDDGIQVSRSGNVLIGRNTIDSGFGGGDDEGGSDEQQLSIFSDEGDYGPMTTGIRLGDNEGCGQKGRCSESFSIARVDFPMGFGDFSGNAHVDVVGNTISNNAVGLHAMAFNNGYIGLFGNQFTDNTIGSWIGSGLIDLTGDSNTFTGGDVAMRFERASYDVYGYPEYDFIMSEGEYDDEGPMTVFADLNLVGDTIGTTIFEGQEQYYIELLNGAFFDPGSPTIIEGRYASFDGFIPGEDPIDPSILQAIEDMINDYDDDRTLGQIFVGIPLNPFDDNDIMRKIFGNNFKPGRSGIFITGLPNANGQGGGSSPQDLANIAPAAGGNDEEGGAGFFANLEPAAGGEDDNQGVVDGKCWGNAAAMAGQAIVSLDLSDDLSDILADQSECGQDL